MAKNFMEFAFNDSVREVQEKYGTRAPYQKMESKNEFRNKLTWQEKAATEEAVAALSQQETAVAVS